MGDSGAESEAATVEVKMPEELDSGPMTTVILNVYVEDPSVALTCTTAVPGIAVAGT